MKLRQRLDTGVREQAAGEQARRAPAARSRPAAAGRCGRGSRRSPTRMLISRSRVVARASSMFATLQHAITSRRLTAPNSVYSTPRNSRDDPVDDRDDLEAELRRIVRRECCGGATRPDDVELRFRLAAGVTPGRRCAWNARVPRAERGSSARFSADGSQRSTMFHSNRGGMTPMIVRGTPSSIERAADDAGSAPNSLTQARWFRTPTGGAPGAASRRAERPAQQRTARQGRSNPFGVIHAIISAPRRRRSSSASPAGWCRRHPRTRSPVPGSRGTRPPGSRVRG